MRAITGTLLFESYRARIIDLSPSFYRSVQLDLEYTVTRERRRVSVASGQRGADDCAGSGGAARFIRLDEALLHELL
jgi:hypothetical protein